MGVIYKITNMINQKCYIGYTTTSFQTRMRKHKNDDVKNDIVLGRAISKYGWSNFTCEIIEESEDKEKLLELEKYYIKFFNSKIPNGYNMTDGGEKLFGENNPFYAHTHTKETKQALSEKASKRIGKLNPFYGKHHKEESKVNMGGHKKPVQMLDDNGNILKTFQSQSEAARWCLSMNLTKSTKANSDIAKRCKDGKKAFGYFWKYQNEGVETMPDECTAVG